MRRRLVVDIEKESDIERLRATALALWKQNETLRTEIDRLRGQMNESLEKLRHLKGMAKAIEIRRIKKLQEQLAALEKLHFGPSSEKRPGKSGPTSPESGGDGSAESGAKNGHPRRPQETLETKPVEHDLDDADKMCPKCGGSLQEMVGQFEESEEIDVIVRRFIKLLHRRKKYRCACNACIETAPGPLKLRPGARYSIEFAIDVAANKYLYHIPLDRLVRMMFEEGLDIDSQTLWDQINALAKINKDLPDRILAHVLAQPCIGADETHWRYLAARGQEEVNKRWYIWSACCDNAVVHRMFDTRSHTAAKELIGAYTGIVITDGYKAYSKLQSLPDVAFILANCWAHARRKFVEAEKFYPKPASAVLNLIAALFVVDDQVDSSTPESVQLAQRQTLREQRSKPIVDAIEVWLTHIKATELPESAIGKAASYTQNLWTGLMVFLSDPCVPLTNNHTERTFRGPVVGRKNHYGSKSKRGMEVAAFFYTIFESAKLAGADPRAYLRHITRAALQSEPVLLPHEFAALRPAADAGEQAAPDA
jgi:transposase